jgi:hypothetical protein
LRLAQRDSRILPTGAILDRTGENILDLALVDVMLVNVRFARGGR